MRFDEIYEPVLALWPERVRIDDGNRRPCLEHESCGDGHYFPALSAAWDEVESAVGRDDRWRSLMAWTLFQAFHSESRRLLRAGAVELDTGSLSASAIEQRYFNNLNVEGWEAELAVYERPATPH